MVHYYTIMHVYTEQASHIMTKYNKESAFILRDIVMGISDTHGY